MKFRVMNFSGRAMDSCSGMTLVEVLVFMGLSLFLLAGSAPLTLQLLRSDYAHEERLAAFEFNKSAIEQLRSNEYSGLTNQCAEKIIHGQKHLKKEKKIKTKNKKKMSNSIDMKPLIDPEAGEYMEVVSEVEWDSIHYGRTNALKSTLTALLYPHVRD